MSATEIRRQCRLVAEELERRGAHYQGVALGLLAERGSDPRLLAQLRQAASAQNADVVAHIVEGWARPHQRGAIQGWPTVAALELARQIEEGGA